MSLVSKAGHWILDNISSVFNSSIDKISNIPMIGETIIKLIILGIVIFISIKVIIIITPKLITIVFKLLLKVAHKLKWKILEKKLLTISSGIEKGIKTVQSIKFLLIFLLIMKIVFDLIFILPIIWNISSGYYIEKWNKIQKLNKIKNKLNEQKKKIDNQLKRNNPQGLI